MRIFKPFALILRVLNEQLDSAGDMAQRVVAGLTAVPLIWLLFTGSYFALALTGVAFFWWVFRIMWKNGNL
tara:strand:+ start:976 stop:1188 length:213 start_codon:yes stop_codon:yes gene_type:complete